MLAATLKGFCGERCNWQEKACQLAGAIFLLKLVLLGFFSSGFQDHIFLPFIRHYVTHWGNPWQYFYQQQSPLVFPYPPLMLWLLTLPVLLIKGLAIQSIFWQNFLFKLPILIADITIFKLIWCLLPKDKRLLFTLLYGFSPLVWYASYFQVQLDLIPTALLFAAIYLSIDERYHLSALLFACSLLTKSHTLIALPLLLMYVYKKEGLRQVFYYLALLLAVYFLVSAPFLSSAGYQYHLLHNKEQGIIFNTFLPIYNLKVYATLVFTLLIYFRFFTCQHVNRDLFLSYLNFAFVVLLLLVYPIPAWYLWIVPFLYLFLAQSQVGKQEMLLYYLIFCLVYLLFFVCYYQHPFSHYDTVSFLGHPISFACGAPPLQQNLVFTLLETLLLGLAYKIYRYSIRSSAMYKFHRHALVIGIAGDSGAGKSTLLKNLHQLLGEKNILQLEGDGDHKWERGNKNWQAYTHLDPRANLLHQQTAMIQSLKFGAQVARRDYDHSTGHFTVPKKVKPKRFIVLAGLHPFYLPKSQKVIDLKIYLDPNEKLRQHWKIARDHKERGHSIEKVLDQLSARQADREKYITPQRERANLIFSLQPQQEFILGQGQEKIALALAVRLSSNIPLERLEMALAQIDTLQCEYDYSRDLNWQEWKLVGTISAVAIQALAEQLVENYYELIGNQSQWQSDYPGLMQLFILLVLSECLRGEHEI